MASVTKPDVREIRNGLGISRKLFSRMTGCSERSIVDWENGKSLGAQSRAKLLEMKRLREGLARVMVPDFIGTWLDTPNQAFGGLKPVEVIERGEVDRIWRAIFYLESGVAS